MYTIQIAATAILAVTAVSADTLSNAPASVNPNAARPLFLEHGIQGNNPVAFPNANGLYPSINNMVNQHPNAIMQDAPQIVVDSPKQVSQFANPAAVPLTPVRGSNPSSFSVGGDSVQNIQDNASTVQQLGTNASPAFITAAAPPSAQKPAALANSPQQILGAAAALAAAAAPGIAVDQQAGVAAKPQSAHGMLTSTAVAPSAVFGPPPAGQLMAATSMPSQGATKEVSTTVTGPAAFDDKEEKFEDNAGDSAPAAATVPGFFASAPATSSAVAATKPAILTAKAVSGTQAPVSFIQPSITHYEPLGTQNPLMLINKASITAFKPDDLDKFTFPTAEASVNMAGPKDTAHPATSASSSPRDVAFQGSKPAEQIAHPKAFVTNTKAILTKSLDAGQQSSKARASAPTSAVDAQTDNAASALVSSSVKAIVAAVIISAFGNVFF
ncbi:hypothetical protein COEREDRAFT_98753 [Coemansia reversa NRRL 1564]|uniref:Uncharacterized protein n=1 Tax=Coemansia reversa (strain ATCC 12441 / NRRL 1564) TaxID=763665 RepID=A0A2G5B6E4_COERN|nr:hypothetical protein COEREDRAFT_98753 [Coemansia reversa NRRL 1564]|eukprot:PIA14579.1 hypothetical protein COEREDRAFT_98753 [Coemansia reversa NRRL 1564]